jgi:hypothetical protein
MIFLVTCLYYSLVMEKDICTLLDLATLAMTFWVMYTICLELNSTLVEHLDNVSHNIYVYVYFVECLHPPFQSIYYLSALNRIWSMDSGICVYFCLEKQHDMSCTTITSGSHSLQLATCVRLCFSVWRSSTPKRKTKSSKRYAW